MNRLRAPVLRHRIFQLAADAVLAAIAFYLAFAIRFIDEPGGIPDRYMTMITGSIVFVALGKTAIFGLMGLHQKWWRYFNLGDIWSVMRACAVASALLIAIFVIAKPFSSPMPRSVMIFDFVFTLGLLVVARSIARFYFVERRMRSHKRRKHDDVLVVGAGSGGQMVVRELRLNPELGNPVGFVDDDPRKRGMRLSGLKVLGGTDELGAILEREKPAEVVIAIPSAPGDVRGKVVSACRERDIGCGPCRPSSSCCAAASSSPASCARSRSRTCSAATPSSSSSIASAPISATRSCSSPAPAARSARSSAGRSPASAPAGSSSSTRRRTTSSRSTASSPPSGTSARCEAVLADCKDGERMLEVMQRFKPDVVFHAAAYKHVPLVEANPFEAVRNNAIGTRVVAETAAVAGAERFVLISTDKAVNPRTVMGASKAMAESIVRSAATRHPNTRFVSVRFGNVLGSSGSVVPIFRSQIERGGPVTVTHPEMTRYFMTIPEAVQLVIRAADLGGDGDVFVLEMGEPVKIVDLARNMIRLAGYEPDADIAIEFTGPAARRAAPRAAPRRRRALRADGRGADRQGRPGGAAGPRPGRGDAGAAARSDRRRGRDRSGPPRRRRDQQRLGPRRRV